MKKLLSLLLVCALLSGCGAAQDAPSATETAPPDYTVPVEISYESRFDTEVRIKLSDEGVTCDVPQGIDPNVVSVGGDIVYYEDRDAYESGNPYGEGEAHERHSAAEANAHTLVTITQPGAYRVSGTLSAGQIAIDLGEDAYEDPNAVVELILDGVDITCTVAPAIVFYNVYECDGNWSTDTAKADVDTSAAGANLILADCSKNTVNGSHVARIYKDKEGEKKLWKIDGAVYSFMSMNVYGPGGLDITADNEGLDTELHLTVHGGEIVIRSENDGINTNEDGVSVTTVNGGTLHIIAGLGEEGDGVDSNGYLVINGGTVIATANPAADAGLDSDLGSYIHGGTVIALGSTMDWAESDSDQVTMNLQFAQFADSGSALSVTREDGTVLFTYDPDSDAVLGENVRRYQGAILSCPQFKQGEGYHVYLDDVQMAYTGTDVRRGGFGEHRPDGGKGDFGDKFPEGEMPSMPEGERPEGFGGCRGQWAEGEMPSMPADWDGRMPENMPPPEGFDGQRPQLPEGKTMPEGFDPGAGRGQGAFGTMDSTGEANTLFYMQDMVNFFSGLTAATE